MMLLLVTAKHNIIFNIFIPTFSHSVLPTLDDEEYFEIFKTYNRGNFLRKENEGKFWFIRLCPCLMPKIGG